MFDEQQTKITARHLDIPPPRTPTLREVSQELYNISQKTKEKPALSYFVTFKDRLDLVLVLPSKNATKNSAPLPVRRITLRANAEDIQKLAQEFFAKKSQIRAKLALLATCLLPKTTPVVDCSLRSRITSK